MATAFVSFADSDSVDLFLDDILTLPQSCALYITAPEFVLQAHPRLEDMIAQRDPHSWDWAKSVDFADKAVAIDLDSISFVLRLPLRAQTTEERAASAEAVRTLASIDAMAAIGSAFEEASDLAIVAPDTLFKPLFPAIGENRHALSEIERLFGCSVTSHDAGYLPGQAFAISTATLKQLAPGLSRYKTLMGWEREVIPYAQPGSVGAAMDLAWASLALKDHAKLGLIRKRLDNGKTELRIGHGSQFALEVGRLDNLVTTLRRLDRAAPDYALLAREPDFDSETYLAENHGLVPEGFDPLEHYVLYGDAANLPIGGPRDLSAYRLAQGSAITQFDNTLCHWIVRGRPILSLKKGRWLDEARSRQLFDRDWMTKVYPEFTDRAEVEKRYSEFPELWQRATSPNFDPATIPVMQGHALGDDAFGLRGFLGKYFRDEQRRYKSLHNLLQSHSLESAGSVLKDIKRLYGDTNGLIGATAYLALMRGDWGTAQEAMEKLWTNHELDHKPVRHAPNLLSDFDTRNAHAFETVKKGVAPDPERVCIYTTLFGDGDGLLPNLAMRSKIRCICFSDRPRHAPGWDVRVVQPAFESPNLSAKYYKVLPHKVLPEFDFSIFIDGNTLLLGDLDRLVNQFLTDNPFAMWRHPDRSDLYREAVAILQSGRHRSKEIFEQIRAYREAGLPDRSGLTEGSFIWRSHSDEETCDFMRDWWSEILTNSARDQLSLGYLFWRRQQRPRVLPARLGTSRRNAFFVKLSHRNPKARTQVARNAPVTFLYHPDRKESGSTVMRGEQLSQMIANAMPEREVTYSSGLVWHGRVLFLTKGFLEKTRTEDLQRLRDQGNFLIGDFVDAKPDRAKGELVDALAAASLASYEYLSNSFPDMPVFNLTHHVDPRIAQGNNAVKFSPAYVGEEVNAIWTDQIRKRITLVQVNTKTRDDSWLQHLQNYNLHYAVRNTRDIDGSKPFLKGFTAARCGACIITQKTVGDAVFYLGDDYPFLLPANPTEDEICSMLDRAKSSFGNPTWKRAQDRMRQLAERCSDEAIISEFKEILQS